MVNLLAPSPCLQCSFYCSLRHGAPFVVSWCSAHVSCCLLFRCAPYGAQLVRPLRRVNATSSEVIDSLTSPAPLPSFAHATTPSSVCSVLSPNYTGLPPRAVSSLRSCTRTGSPAIACSG
eukprot:2203295-Pleurochrysis_carterae.AAC.1